MIMKYLRRFGYRRARQYGKQYRGFLRFIHAIREGEDAVYLGPGYIAMSMKRYDRLIRGCNETL